MKPKTIRIRMYQVGFGDCFLLTFSYSNGARHLLIDFGTTGSPKDEKVVLPAIAADIAATVGKEPFAVVATHRHADHIAGFDPGAKGTGPGATIAALKPRFVVQPWTEDPRAKVNADAPPGKLAMARRRNTLDALHAVAAQVVEQSVPRFKRSPATRRYAAELEFIGQDNLKNLAAVRNLMDMAPNDYVYAGKATRLSRFLPGVSVQVLGPPTVAQDARVKKQKQRDPEEFWQLRARSFGLEADSVRSEKGEVLFPELPARRGSEAPEWARWLIRRQRTEHAEETLQLVRQLDSALNNTSVILHFGCGKQSILFPGDAQIENWQYALGQTKWTPLLSGVTTYKVGHHGSLNATPKSLWRRWFPKGSKVLPTPKRMVAMLSTMEGKHGDDDTGTEVPRRKLVYALKSHTRLRTTQSLHKVPYLDEILTT